MDDIFKFVVHLGGPLSPVTMVYRNGEEIARVQSCQVEECGGVNESGKRVTLGFIADHVEVEYVHANDLENA